MKPEQMLAKSGLARAVDQYNHLLGLAMSTDPRIREENKFIAGRELPTAQQSVTKNLDNLARVTPWWNLPEQFYILRLRYKI